MITETIGATAAVMILRVRGNILDIKAPAINSATVIAAQPIPHCNNVVIGAANAHTTHIVAPKCP